MPATLTRKPPTPHERAVASALDALYYALPRDWPRLAGALLDAQNALAVQFRAAAHFVARKVLRRFPLADYDELADECMVGIIKAARRWRPGRGASFSTFANNGAYFAGRTWAGRSAAGGFTGLSHRPGFAPFVVSTVTHGGDESPITEVLLAPEEPAPDLTREEWAKVLAVLSDRERAVLDMRYGEGKKLGQIGAALGVCKERVRQLEVAAVEKLRKYNDRTLGGVA